MTVYALTLSEDFYLELDEAVEKVCGMPLQKVAKAKGSVRRTAFRLIHKIVCDFQGEETVVRDTEGAVIAATSMDGDQATRGAEALGMAQAFASATSVKIMTYPDSVHEKVMRGDYRSCKKRISFRL